MSKTPKFQGGKNTTTHESKKLNKYEAGETKRFISRYPLVELLKAKERENTLKAVTEKLSIMNKRTTIILS